MGNTTLISLNMFVPINFQTAPKGKRLKCELFSACRGCWKFFRRTIQTPATSICERTCVSERSMQRSPPEICLSEIPGILSTWRPCVQSVKIRTEKRVTREEAYRAHPSRSRVYVYAPNTISRRCGNPSLSFPPSSPSSIIFSQKRFLPEKRSRHAYTYPRQA